MSAAHDQLSFLIPPSTLAIVSTFIAAVLILLFLNKISNRNEGRKMAEGLSLPPGSYGWPILGETVHLFRSFKDGVPERFFRERIERCQSKLVFKTSLMGENVAVFCGPAGNKFLFSNENKLVNLWWPPSVKRLLGLCLPNTVGDDAKQMRKMLSNFVSPDALLRLYTNTIDLVTQQHIENYWQGKKEVIVLPTVNAYTFGLACRLFMSLEGPEYIAKLRVEFDIFLKGIISIPVNLPGTRFYNAKRARSEIVRELRIIVRQRKEALEKGTASPSQDLLSHLLTSSNENNKFGTESVIINTIIMLLFAGHDTTTASLTSLMKCLAELPEIYENVLKEQREIASSKRPGEYLQWEDIQKMKYSWNVVSESMRLAPSAIGVFREALVDFSYAGYRIPKGWKLYWSSSFTHRDPSLFPNPTQFDPSRFEGEGPSPFSYVPFGGGPRMCIGKEFARMVILTFLHHIITRFRWNLLIPDEKIEYDPTPMPVKGLPVQLQPHDGYSSHADSY